MLWLLLITVYLTLSRNIAGMEPPKKQTRIHHSKLAKWTPITTLKKYKYKRGFNQILLPKNKRYKMICSEPECSKYYCGQKLHVAVDSLTFHLKKRHKKTDVEIVAIKESNNLEYCIIQDPASITYSVTTKGLILKIKRKKNRTKKSFVNNNSTTVTTSLPENKKQKKQASKTIINNCSDISKCDCDNCRWTRNLFN